MTSTSSTISSPFISLKSSPVEHTFRSKLIHVNERHVMVSWLVKAVISCLRLLPSSSSVRMISLLVWTWPLALRVIVCLIHCTHSYGRCLAWSGAYGAMLSRKNPLFNTAGFAGGAADARHLLNPSVRLNIGRHSHRYNQATQVCLPVDVPCAGHGRP